MTIAPSDPRYAKAVEAMARAADEALIERGAAYVQPLSLGRIAVKAALAALAEEGVVLTDTREVERLRAQNKAHAERRDREQATMEAKIARHKNSIADARKRMEYAAVDWTKDPPSQRPGGWWSYTSSNNIAEVVAIVEEIERLREKAERYDLARTEVKLDGNTRAHYVIQRDTAIAEVERLRERLRTMNECVRIYVNARANGYEPVRQGWLEEEIAATDDLFEALSTDAPEPEAMVAVSEVAQWLRLMEPTFRWGIDDRAPTLADQFLLRFGGGDAG